MAPRFGQNIKIASQIVLSLEYYANSIYLTICTLFDQNPHLNPLKNQLQQLQQQQQ